MAEKVYPFETLETKIMPAAHKFMALELIYRVYHDEEKWIPENPMGLAQDSYDKEVIGRIGVYTTIDWTFPERTITKRSKREIWPEETVKKGTLIAHQRLLRWPSVFMFVEEYENIGVGVPVIQGPHVGEVSRMTIHRRFRDIGLSNSDGIMAGGVAMMVYVKQKELCEFMGIDTIYTATTSAQMRLLRSRGLPLKTMKTAKIKDMATGRPVSIEVDVMDLNEFNPVIANASAA